MSITVAVNATDGANGPQAAVCQSAAQHNNCGDYNGTSDGGGGGDGGIGIDGGGLGVGSVNGDAPVVLNNERKDQRVRSFGTRATTWALTFRGRRAVRSGTTFVDESSMCRLPAAFGCRRRSVFSLCERFTFRTQSGYCWPSGTRRSGLVTIRSTVIDVTIGFAPCL